MTSGRMLKNGLVFWAAAVTLVFVLSVSPIRGSAGDVVEGRVLGDPNAPVTITEFASLSCPHCAMFHTDRLPWLKKTYIDTGKVKLVFRDFPLNQPALYGALILHRAKPDSFFPFLDMLFAAQTKWISLPGIESEEHLAQIEADGCLKEDWPPLWQELAKMVRLGGLGEAEFSAAMCDTALRDEILAARQEAQTTYDIESTPSFLIGGKVHPGVLAEEEFARLIEAAMPEGAAVQPTEETPDTSDSPDVAAVNADDSEEIATPESMDRESADLPEPAEEDAEEDSMTALWLVVAGLAVAIVVVGLWRRGKRAA